MRSYILGIAETLYNDCPPWQLSLMPEHFVQLHEQTSLGWWKAQRYLVLDRRQCELLLADPYEVLWLITFCRFFADGGPFKGNYELRIVLTGGAALCRNSDIQVFDNCYNIGWNSRTKSCTIAPSDRVRTPRTRVDQSIALGDFVEVMGRTPPEVIQGIMEKL